jgi:hypothetical protein
MRLGTFVLTVALLAGCVELKAEREPAAEALHAYYLFRFRPAGTSEYIPLIVTREPLEALAAAESETTPVVLITTYERDSIWRVEHDVPIATATVSAARRSLRVRDVEYRYQEIAPAEVLRLLEHPEGTLSIHRRMGLPRREEMRDLIAGFGGDPGP